jgi:restriction system protein
MPIPTTDEMIIPVLQYIADGQEYRRLDIINMLTERFSLTEDERRRLGRSGQMEKSLSRKGFIERPRTGYYQITTLGRETLSQSLEEISTPDINTGTQVNLFASSSEENHETGGNNQHPEESIEENYQQIRKELATELLQKIKNNTPAFFEKLVVNLLVNMGYGGSWEDAGEVTGGPGDGGIDGIINQDKLGLDVVGIQAKLRTTGNNVGPSVINEFVGALRLKGLGKGVIITIASFSSSTRASAEGSDNPKIVLIDGEQLAQLMIDHNVGVSTVDTYEIKRVDSDYFAENTENS